jgi:hypothetical protein
VTLGDIDLYEIGKSNKNLKSWKNLLSNALDLSALPLAVEPPNLCDMDGTEKCEPFLKFRLIDTSQPELIFKCQREEFKLISSSNLLQQRVTYWFPLRHVWFWSDECVVREANGTSFEIVDSKASTSLY